MKHILSADIGGTNSRFAHFTRGAGGDIALVSTQWLKTQDARSFGDLLRSLQTQEFSLKPGDADIAVIAIAGPIERGVFSSPPFISWDMDISHAREQFGFRKCTLINDFVAQAFACPSPVGKAAKEILPGRAVPRATLAVLGAGTALGKAALVPDESGTFVAVPSEGGHGDFPFVSTDERRYQDFLVREYGEEHIMLNTVISGKGLSLVHQFLTGEKLEPKEVAARCVPGCETLAWAARLFGRACRNYALDVLALGGVYFAGGVAAKTPELLTHESFGLEFRQSRTMGKLLADIPVFLIQDEISGLWGGAFYGAQQLAKG